MPLSQYSLKRAGWRTQIIVSYSLMAIIPLLTSAYLILTYIMPNIVTEENIALVVLLNILISLGGFFVVFMSMKGLAEFRDHLKKIADGNFSSRIDIRNGPDVTSITRSIERIVERMVESNQRLQALSSDLEKQVGERTAELKTVNRKLEEELRERKNAEQALRDSNIQLSDALARLKELQQAIIQQERLSALGQMASGIAHDMNNVLMPILGFSELILSSEALQNNPKEIKEIVQDIKSAADDARDVLQRLREFYRPPTDLKLSGANLADIVRDAVRMTSPKWKDQSSAAGKNIVVRENLSDIPAFGLDVTQMREALVNIIFNSVDAMPKGGVIEISTRVSGKMAVIEIADSGTGMPEEALKRCFEPFFTTKLAGTGMGLAVTYGIIRRHRGTISISSQPNKGTRVTIQIPIETPVPGKPQEPEAAVSISPLNILIIDDDERSRQVLQRGLEAEGHKLTVTNNGRDGVSAFGRHTFDLVISDRAMPDMNGDVVTREIKKQNPRIPIIMLTGFGDLMKDRQEQPEGVDIILGKPSSMTDVKRAMAELLPAKIVHDGAQS